MKTNSQAKKIRSRCLSRTFRLAAAGVLVLAGAALAYIGTAPTLPWAVPTVSAGIGADVTVVDQATHTVYVTNNGDTTVSVIDGRRCNSSNSSHCSPIGTITVGPNPIFMAFDPTTGTLYMTINSGTANTIAVVNANTCNNRNTSGCGQTPASVTVPGHVFPTINPNGQAANLALDTATHALYVGDADEGPVSFVNTATCNGTNTAGCRQPLVTAAAHGENVGIDHSNHSVYVTNINDGTLSVFNGATCNPGNTSGCNQSAGPYPGFNALSGIIVDETTHTVYVSFLDDTPLSYIQMVDGSTCNGTNSSGCGNAPPLVQIGSFGFPSVIDPTTRTLYASNADSSSISVINTATCNATNQSGCTPTPLPALATGPTVADSSDIDLSTHTLYAASQDLNNVWVLNAATCNATYTAGCTKFAPVTTIGNGPGGVAANPNTQTAYVTNQDDNTISVIDTTVCNNNNLAGCNQSWPTIPVGNFPRFLGINKITNTIYVSNLFDNTIGIINGATCNRSTTAGCTQVATTPVGKRPQTIAVDEATNTVYVANRDSNTVSVINGAVCNATNTLGCSGGHWRTVSVGDSPLGLALNPANHTLYVTNSHDDSVSVINASTCNGTTTSGCNQRPPTISVGSFPAWGIGVDPGTNTVFAGNLNDLTVSVINGATCNGTNRSGCGQVPPAVIVGAFPSTAGNGSHILAQTVLVDPATHKVYIPTLGDGDVAVIDGSVCTGSNTSHCQASIVSLRMGGHVAIAGLDDSSGTVYVSNNADGTVSLFAK